MPTDNALRALLSKAYAANGQLRDAEKTLMNPQGLPLALPQASSDHRSTETSGRDHSDTTTALRQELLNTWELC
jgi:hypothetical protein